MSNPLNRRGFLIRSAGAASAAAWSHEECALLAQQTQPAARLRSVSGGDFPAGKIGPLTISRLICGGNLISGFAHSRDLIYVSALLQHYFTDERVADTLELCEELGLNTAILRVDDHTVRILQTYRRDRGGRLQWIAQAKLPSQDPHADIKRAIDNGAVGVYLHGGVCDSLIEKGDLDPLAKALEVIRQNGIVSGIAGHQLAVHQAAERAGLNADFYMKTFNAKNYWSAGPQPRHDSVWEETPEETRQFMAGVRKPWIAYKVLGAGAIHPRDGFAYAFDHGADFICVGMFDFQIAEDIEIARQCIDKAQARRRPWCA